MERRKVNGHPFDLDLAEEEAQLRIELHEHNRLQEFENAVMEQLPELFFFHEHGRRVGMVPRSSLKKGHNQMVKKRTKTAQQQIKQNQPQPTGRDSTTKQNFLCTEVKEVRRKLLTVYGPEFTKEEHDSKGLCSAKSQRSCQMDFTSLLLVTSGHCAEWQKHGHNASPGHWYAPTQV